MSRPGGRRRTRAVAVLATVAALLLPAAAAADPFDDPHRGYASSRTPLTDGSPRSAGLDAAPVERARAEIRGYLEPQENGHPMYSGAVGLMGHDRRLVAREVAGHALRWQDPETELPRERWVPMREDTIFDLASVSKVFTSIAVVQLVEEGRVDPAAPVADYLPEFAAGGKEEVTVEQLLTHTSGLVAWLPLWSRYDTEAARVDAVLAQPLDDPPGSVYRYSDLNLITLGVLVERLRGQGLDEVVAERITEPLGMDDTGYNPTERTRTAATEYQASPERGVVWGQVHDENAWSLGGVAGHAGVFSTADDLAVLAQTLIDGGSYDGRRILSRASVDLLVTDRNAAFPGDGHGLGLEIDQRWYMGALSGPRTIGHTGYTGTSFIVDLDSRSFAVLLTNRVHPSRSWGSNNPARRAWADALADAMGVRPRRGRTAWHSTAATADQAPSGTAPAVATLTSPALHVRRRPGRLDLDVFVDTGAAERLVLERSTDGTTWEPLPVEVRLRGRGSTGERIVADDGVLSWSGRRAWGRARAELPAGTTHVRWRHVIESDERGRGVMLDDIRVTGDGPPRDLERAGGSLVADGWEPRPGPRR